MRLNLTGELARFELRLRETGSVDDSKTLEVRLEEATATAVHEVLSAALKIPTEEERVAAGRGLKNPDIFIVPRRPDFNEARVQKVVEAVATRLDRDLATKITQEAKAEAAANVLADTIDDLCTIANEVQTAWSDIEDAYTCLQDRLSESLNSELGDAHCKILETRKEPQPGLLAGVRITLDLLEAVLDEAEIPADVIRMVMLEIKQRMAGVEAA